MLGLWPLVTWVLYSRTSPEKALIWTILAGYLLLPPVIAINLPVVPNLDKETIPNLAALFMVLFVLKDRVPIMPQSLVGKGLIILFVLSPFATVLTNGDPVPNAHEDLQGMRVYDSIASVANQAIQLLPFFLARKYLATPDAMRAILVALVAAGVAYSVPMALESRLSPQLNVWIYGYFQHDFFQTIRFGGYRPVVFLQHGLWVAFFALMALMSAMTLLRVSPADNRPKYLFATLYLAAMLVICKSAGPVIYALVLTPMILFVPRRLQLVLAGALAAMVVVYPLLRGAHLVPLDQMLEAANRFDPNRALSFQFRITNEEQLLNRANERPWFGWGGYGRNLLYDPITGQGLSIADGAWIITLGIYGWLGYIALFGLLALPLILILREGLLQRSAAISPFTCAVALIFAVNMLDMLPNATLIPFTWLMAGALLGRAEALALARRQAARETHGMRISARHEADGVVNGDHGGHRRLCP